MDLTASIDISKCIEGIHVNFIDHEHPVKGIITTRLSYLQWYATTRENAQTPTKARAIAFF